MDVRTGIVVLGATLLGATGAGAFVLFDDPLTRRPGGEYTIATQISHPTLGATSPSGPSWDAAFAEALDAWNDAPGLGALVDLSATPGFEGPCDDDDDVHGVGFEADFCGVPWGGTTLAIAARSFTPGGLVTEGNIVFRADSLVNANWDVVAGPQGAFDDFRRVAVHEIGHLLGLDHPPGSNAIMFATVQDGVEVPQADDIAGVTTIYDLGCPDPIASGSQTLDDSLDATDCLDTDIGLPVPGAVGDCTQISSFEANSFVDLYEVALPAGETLDVTLRSTGAGGGDPVFNPTVQVFNANLSSELGCDWNNPMGAASLSLALTPGTYVVATRSVFAGGGTNYELTIAPEPGSAALVFAALTALWGTATRRR